MALVIPLDLMVLVVVGVLVAVNVDVVMAVAIVVRVPCVLHVWIFVLFYHSPVAGGCRGVGDKNYGSDCSFFVLVAGCDEILAILNTNKRTAKCC